MCCQASPKTFLIDGVERCGRTGKKCYSYRSAHCAAKHGKKCRGVNKHPLRFYKCEHCGWWHLTSKRKKSR